MKNESYVLNLMNLLEEEEIIKHALDTYTIDRSQKDYLFKQLDIICKEKQALSFKIELNQRLQENEKSR